MIRPGGPHVGPGESLQIGAKTWNGLQDVLAAYRATGLPDPGGEIDLNVQPALTAVIRNTTSEHLDRGSVLWYTGSPVTVANEQGDREAASSPTLNGSLSGIGRIAITLTDIGPGQMGLCVIQGLAVANVLNTGLSLGLARATSGQANLSTHAEGTLPIIHLPGAVGVVSPAIVFVGAQAVAPITYPLAKAAVTHVQCDSVGNLLVTRDLFYSPVGQGAIVSVVRDNDNSPVPGRIIQLEYLGSPPHTISGPTDLFGSVRFLLAPGNWRASVQAVAGVTFSPGTATMNQSIPAVTFRESPA